MNLDHTSLHRVLLEAFGASEAVDPIVLIAALGLVFFAATFVCLRNARRDRIAWHGALEALGPRLEAQDATLTSLGRAVTALLPAARPVRSAAPPSMPYRPTPVEVAAAREAHSTPPPSIAQRLEQAVLPEAPADTTGDRVGLVPEPPAVDRSPSSQPPASDRDSSQDVTRVMSSRAMEAAWQGILMSSGLQEPPSSAPSIEGDPIETRYQTFRAAARAAGERCDHCHGADCWADEEAILCTCACGGCRKARELCKLAEREVTSGGAP